ncbi:MAG: hypothetical protein K2Y37_17180 [Pirellulales bacterium]|nr:hypothetical protein [Pirellulales bacterium]
MKGGTSPMLFRALVFILVCSAIALQSSAEELKVEPDEENVVASKLLGIWKQQDALTKRLRGVRSDARKSQSFISEPGITAKIPEKYVRVFLVQKIKIYVAGYMELHNDRHPFVLIQLRGNPTILYWRERDGDAFGDTESFTVMVAAATDKKDDLLFIGGDFNNQAFTAYERQETSAPRP